MSAASALANTGISRRRNRVFEGGPKCRPPLWYVDACRRGSWSLRMMKTADPDDWWWVPFRCRSWRCKGDCARWKGAQDFRRIQHAIRKRNDWTLLVLTYDQRYMTSIWQCYRRGKHFWDKLRKRIIREFGPIKYIQTWEKHRSGFPHVNVVIGNADFHHFSTHWWKDLRDDWLVDHATRSGFGPVVLGGPLRDKNAMAGYMVKLAHELAGSDTKDQRPVNAPRNFRRLRSSVRLLPPPFKDERITGVIHFCKPEEWHTVSEGLQQAAW